MNFDAWRNTFTLATFALLSIPCRSASQTVDFESPIYIADKTIVDVDGWTKSIDASGGSPDNFKILAGVGNKVVHCLTQSLTTISRSVPYRAGLVDVRWRWRANGDSVHMCFGVSGNLGGARISSRALVCMDPKGYIEGQGLNSMTSSISWVKLNWTYMRMVLDVPNNLYTLYMASDSLRMDEREALGLSIMNGAGPLSRIVLRDENGSGSVDIDDISYENIAEWVGESDSLWSVGKNWSTGTPPDSLTHVLITQNSNNACLVDKNFVIKSLDIDSLYDGTLNLGVSLLTVTENTVLTGGKFAYQPGGMLRLSSSKAQSLVGHPGGVSAPPIRHDGIGTLRLDTRPLFGTNLAQVQGRLNFNGFDLFLVGDLTIKNGQPNTLLNLDGRSISVGKTARIEGTSKDTLLGLNSLGNGSIPAKGWSIAVTITDTLMAKFVSVGNSRATLATGYAFQSNDAGGNLGWIFISPPSIVSSPKDVSLYPGETAFFKTSASSKLPLTYQWMRDDQDILGAKDSIYAITGIKLSDNGATLTCRVTNMGGSVTSMGAKVKVNFPAPTPFPGPQEIVDSLHVILTPSVVGSKTYFSRNGSTYTEFLSPIILKDSTLLKAYSVYLEDSSILGTWTYTKKFIPQVQTPAISPDPLTFVDSQIVTILGAPGGATYYTLDQTDPDSTKKKYLVPFTVKGTTTVSARSFKFGMLPSEVRTNIYRLKTQDPAFVLPLPHALPAGGFFVDSISVVLSPPAIAPDAVLYYTYNGGGLLKYTQALILREPGILKVIAFKETKISDTAQFTFFRRIEAPSAMPKGQNFSDSILITLTTKITGASIYYTWDGSDPTTKSRLYPGVPIRLDSSANLRAIAVKGTDTSATLSETYSLIAETPQVSPKGGDYSSKLQLQLSVSTSRALIYYTLDGSTPGPESGRQPYTSPIALDTTATLKAVAVTGHGLQMKRSPMLIENYTFIIAGKRILGPGQKLDLSNNYSLTSPLIGSSPVIVDVLKVDSLSAVKGFRDIQFAIRLSLPEGATAFPNVTFTSPVAEARAMYSLIGNTTVNFLSDADSYEIHSPGTYFLGIDTLPPLITLSGESFTPGDSTKVVFTIKDNVSNLILDLERTDIPDRNINGKPIISPEIVTSVMKNSSNAILPLGLKIRVYDYHQKTSFPADLGAYYFLTQKISKPIRTPSLFNIGADAANPWDLITIPLELDPPLTLAQLRKNNSAPGMNAVTWDQPNNKYRILTPTEEIHSGASVWLASTTSMASLLFPTLQTVIRKEKGAYKITLHTGWNQVANPSMTTLYWPVTRKVPDVYDISPVKGLHSYDPTLHGYSFSDSLTPWRGYFVYYKGGRDTVIELHFQPMPVQPGSPRTAKWSAGAGLSLTLAMGRFPSLRLGASPLAKDEIGFEDESRPPPQNENGPMLWSSRKSIPLETDILHWTPGAVYSWNVVARLPDLGNLNDTASLASLGLPDGYAAWAFSLVRHIRFQLREGGAIHLHRGVTDSLEILVGPAAELESRLASIPLSVDAFKIEIAANDGFFAMNLNLPQATHLHWTLWSLDGRNVESGEMTLAEGRYHLLRGAKGKPIKTGMYVFTMDWALMSSTSGTEQRGRVTRKIPL